MRDAGIQMSVRALSRAVLFCVVLIAAGLPALGAEAVRNPETYVHAGLRDPATLDHAHAYDVVSSVVIANIYETLIDFEGVHIDRFVPLLATAIPSLQNGLLSRDGRSYTFPIRRGVRFHDGTPMTAEDVAYSLRRFMLIGAGPSSLLLEPTLGLYRVQDEQGALTFTYADLRRVIRAQGESVVITLKEPFGALLPLLANYSFVVSQRWAVANGDWDGTAPTMVRYANARIESTAFFDRANGTGPFRLERWDRGRHQVVLARHDAYWRTPARLARVVLQTIPETATRVLMLKAGDADSISLGRPDLPLVEGAPGVRVIDNLPVTPNMSAVLWFVVSVETRGNPYLGSGRLDGEGIPGEFFADVHVRRAFGFAFDYAAFIAGAYRGKAVQARGMFPLGLLGYNPRQPYFTHDRERAIAEFKAAWGGVLWERGFRLALVYVTGRSEFEVAARILKESVEALHPRFRIDVTSLPGPSSFAEVRNNRLPVFWGGYAADYPDPHNLAYNFLHSASMRLQRYKTPEDVDQLIIRALRELDPVKRERLYFQVNQKYFELAPSIALAEATGFRVQRSWVRGWYYNPAGWPRFYGIWKE